MVQEVSPKLLYLLLLPLVLCQNYHCPCRRRSLRSLMCQALPDMSLLHVSSGGGGCSWLPAAGSRWRQAMALRLGRR